MNRRHIGLVAVFFLFSVLTISAQEQKQLFSFGIGYFGETITHPGVELFAEYPLFQLNSSKILLRCNFGYYNHSDYSHNFFILPEIVYNYQFPNGIFVEPSVGAGWLCQFPDGKTVSYDSGTFVTTTSVRHYFMPSAALKGGFVFTVAGKESLVLASGFRAFWQYPFNSQWLFHPAIEFEFRYRFLKEDEK
ncbi:MAG: hypothetical protein PQJ46_12700 [Spirochaetales bacterium]|nr:hypothetical protein [Spirochaetales bacterium]